MKVIDLFAGCGGFSLGFENAGYSVIIANEFDSNIAETYSQNHNNVNLIIEDIKQIADSNIFKKGIAEIIIGGPPCQGFSMAGARNRQGFLDDPRNYLFKYYFNIVRRVKPKIFVIENVKGLVNMQNGKILNEIVSLFSDPNLLDGDQYYIHYKVLNSSDFGVPQKRERVFIIGVLNNDFNFNHYFEIAKNKILSTLPNFFEKVTVWDAISDIYNIDNNLKYNFSDYQISLKANGNLFNHITTNHSNKALERIKQIKNGENFKSLNENIKSIHSGSYGRMNKNDVSTTITTRFDTPSGGMYIHPYENRTITPREAARIQSFPDDFIFYGSKTSVCKQIGNAVPPKIAYFLAIMVRGIYYDHFK